MPPKRPAPPAGAGNPNAPVKNESASSEQATAGAENTGAGTSNSTPTATPAPSSRPATPANRASPSVRGGKPVVAAPKPKFAGRRSQAARQEAEQAEAKKKAAEAEAAAQQKKKEDRDAKRFGYGRGGARGRGRGRGGHMGDSHRHRDEPVASGPFGSGQASAENSKRWGSSGRGGGGGGSGGGSGAFGGGYSGSTGGSRSGGGGGGGGGSGGRSYGSGGGVKMESGMGDVTMGGMGMPIKAEDGGYISSDEEGDTGPRQDVESMKVIDLTGDDATQPQDFFAPVRLTRIPHKDRTVALNIENESTPDSSDTADHVVSDKRKGKQRAKDIVFTGANERQKRPTAYSSSSDTDGEPQIKEEPTGDDHQTRPMTPEPVAADGATAQDPPSSPETKRKAKEKIKATVDTAILEDSDEFPMPEEPKFQTEVEREEWLRQFEDLRMLRDELGSVLVQGDEPEPVPPAVDAQGDSAMTEADTAAAATTTASTRPKQSARAAERQAFRERGVYVFQFPPVLPGLSPITVKDDPDSIRVGRPDDVPMDVDQDQQAEDGKVKKEDGFSITSASMPKLPSGAVGKLRVHKSGKTTLDWGGTSMVLGMGADATFLQNVMLAKLPEKKPEPEGSEKPGPATDPDDQEPAIGLGMGQIRGKFVLTPDWDEILR